MLHSVLVAGHAIFGAVALGAAVFAFKRPPRAAGVHLVSVVLMFGFLVGAVAVSWAELDGVTRVLFLALCALGLVVVAHGMLAWRRRPERGDHATRAYRASLAFSCIALTDAFLVVLVLDLGAPSAVVVATGLVVAVAGHILMRRRLQVLHPPGPSRKLSTSYNA